MCFKNKFQGQKRAQTAFVTTTFVTPNKICNHAYLYAYVSSYQMQNNI